MSRGQNPLIWMMAVSLPTAGHALGLGEIHVDSALNEPLSAEIDIVGAAPEELGGLTASVANRDTFLHFGAERHNFLSSTSFKISQDANGRPVLAIRSTESFSEPLVDLIVDLRWRNGELIRQYTLLLDPAGFPSAARNAQPLATPASRVAPAALIAAPAAERAAQSAPVIAPRGRRQPGRAPATKQTSEAPESPAAALQAGRKSLKVGAKATLRGIAWRIGARSHADINRTMFAIFRANPDAFDGNINQLHRGALLSIPSVDEVASISQTDANREIRSQMSSWLSTWKGASVASGRPAAIPAVSNAPAAPAVALPTPAQAIAPAANGSTPAQTVAAQPAPAAIPAVPVHEANPAVPTAPVVSAAKSVGDMNDTELSTRIRVLESSLRDMQAQLESEHNKMLNVQAQARYAEQHPAVTVQAPARAAGNRSYTGVLIAGIAVLLGALGALFVRSRRTPPSRPAIPIEPSVLGPEPVLSPSVSYAPIYRAPEKVDSRIEVTESPAESDSLIELSRLEPSADLSAELGINHPSNADTAVINPGSIDTAARDAAKRRDEEAAERMRQELEAAWSIPSAEQYQRFDETEATLAEAIENSIADTARILAMQADHQATDLIESSDTVKPRAILDSTSTVVGAGETVVMEADTAKLPAATMAMHADEIARAFEEPTVQQPRPDPNHIDFDLLNLDGSAMPDVPGHVIAKGRSTPLDGLKIALRRAPVDRPDVRMVLIETFFEQSAISRQTFQEALATLNSEPALLTEDEWEKVHQMAKQIAA